MAFPVSHHITPEEYLAAERAADHKSEYFHGQVFAMAGASAAHTRICANLIFELELRLRGSSCATYTSDLRVQIPSTGLYTYPDVTVVCGEAEYEDRSLDTLVNPALVVEVLSPSTEAYDRGAKFAHYRGVPSLREYVLVAQDRASVDHYVRRGEVWELSSLAGLSASLSLHCAGSAIPLTGIYDRVTLPQNPGR